MTDKEDRFPCLFGDSHENLGHSADLGYTPRRTFEHITREHRDRINDDDISLIVMDRRDDILEYGTCQKFDILMCDTEPMCTC